MADEARVGKNEVMFTIASGGLLAMTVASVGWDRPADPTLVAAFVTLLGVPVFFSADRKAQK